ncbi:putative methyltransferase TARBP1 [Frankliniella fusca]|uniref:Methyltransferase TARBP1 n=1 Tax=Frankliniella fusca TaxID=407009 RepID=A0AAE1HG15_9NEOP|nr:putative methyltransferase TARBP1 [Frankliniella fusca]
MEHRDIFIGTSKYGTDQLKDEVKSVLEYLGQEEMGKNLNQAILAVCGRFLLGDKLLSSSPEKRKALQTLSTLLRTLNNVLLERTGKLRVDPTLSKCAMTVALSELRDLSNGVDNCITLLCDVLRQSLKLMEEGEREEWIASVKTECENALGVEVFEEMTTEVTSLKAEACLHILEIVLESVYSSRPRKGSDFDDDQKSPTSDLSPFINTCNMKLHQIFVRMVLGNNEGHRAHLLVVLIPLLVKVEGSVQLLRELWDALCGLDCDESGFRSLGTVCALADFFLPVENRSYRIKRFPLVDRPKFWRLLQNGICAQQPLARKQALYLLKRGIDELARTGKSVNITELEWDAGNANALQATWQDLFLVLEALEEAQAHLVRPVLNILSRLLNSHNTKKSCISLPWILCAFQRVLLHSSQVITLWGIETLLGPDGCNVLSGKEAQTFCRFILKSVLPSLNSATLFSADSTIFKTLTEFFCLASKQTVAKTFFSHLLHALTTMPWSPVPLFFLSEALAQVPPVPCWSSRDLKEMQKMVLVTLQTQSVMIRAATQSRLLMGMTHLTDPQHLDLNVVCDLLGVFNRDECLRRGTEAWLGVVRWLCKFVESNNAISWLTNIISRPSKPELALARLIVLLLDARKLDNLDVLAPILEAIEDCETRLYACQDSQNFCMKLLAHLIQESEPLPINSEEDSTRHIVMSFTSGALSNCLSLAGVRLKKAYEMADFHQTTAFLLSLEILFLDPVTLPLLASLNLETLLQPALDVLKYFGEKPPLQVFFAVSIFKFIAIVQEHSCLDRVRPTFTEALSVVLSSGQLAQPLITHRDSKLPQEVLELQGLLVSTHTQVIWELLAASPEIFKVLDGAQMSLALDAAEVTLEFGGRTAIAPLLLSLKHLLSRIPTNLQSHGIRLLESCWSAVLDLRRNELFWPALNAFIAALMQASAVIEAGWASSLALKCGQELLQLGDSVCGVANLLVLSLQSMAEESLQSLLQSPLRELIVSALIFGPVHRKDQRSTNDTCKFIKSLGERCSANMLIPFGDRSDAAVRAVAVQIISRLGSRKEVWRENIADLIVKDLLERDRAPQLRRSRYFGDSQIHRSKNRILQSLLILEPFTSPATKRKLLKWTKENLISENHQPSVRYQTEWLLVRLLCSRTEEMEDFLSVLRKGTDLRASAVCSLVGVLLHIALMLESNSLWTDSEIEKYFHSAMEILVPLSMAQHFNVRLHAQVAILQMWQCIKSLKLQNVQALYEVVVQSVRTSLQQASGAGHTRHQHDFYFHAFHPTKNYTLQTIFEDLPRLANVTSDEWISVDHLVAAGFRCNRGPIPLRNPDDRLKEFQPSPWVQRPSSSSDLDTADSSVFQKKMIPWKWTDPTEDLVQSLPEYLQHSKQLTQVSQNDQKPSLVVVASLIDKAPNQGGLARTCEIMGAALVLPSLSCAQDREFRALSMSAEMWIPMCEVKPFQLPQFLADMKSLGYTLVGAEQTAGSSPLNKTCFPEHTVLLLGNEREGVPANILPLLDQCVEVPQCGVVRSLNVHVTGALFMWEYACQHVFEKKENI